MNIGVDIDNVISNFNEELLKEYLKYDKKLNGNGIVNKEEYITKMFNLTEEESIKFYKGNIERIANNLKPIKDCSKYLKKLRKNGFKIYIITGRDNGEYKDPYNMTIKWLKKYDINYDEIFLVNSHDHHSKTDICLKNNISIMIDDSKKMCSDIKEHGITAFLYDTPYNRDTNDFIRVHSWKEIYNNILNYNKKIDVILDTDTYNECDDQFALSYLIKSKDLFNIKAITVAPCSHKNSSITIEEYQELSYKEILKICNWLNFNAINKVFKGSKDYITNGYDSENDAVNKIIEIALTNEKTYVLAIGALTNIALAIKKEPKIIDKIEVIWLGGNELGYKDNLEYNFRQDIEAVKIVFESKVNLTILPCKNVVSELKIDINILKDKLENKSELCNYLINRFYNDGYHGIQESRTIWDIAVVAYMINRKWFKEKEISCPNIKQDTSYEHTTNKHNITIVTKLDRNKIYKDLFEKLGE